MTEVHPDAIPDPIELAREQLRVARQAAADAVALHERVHVRGRPARGHTIARISLARKVLLMNP